MTTIFFAFLANKASFKSIELAPNPGYSLVISKSYVVMTIFAAVPLFGAHLSAMSLLAILCIVGFSALIVLGGKVHHTKSTAWLPLAIFAFFGWGCMSLIAKYVFSHGWSPVVYLVYAQPTILACALIEMYRRKIRADFITKNIGLFALIGLSHSAFTFSIFFPSVRAQCRVCECRERRVHCGCHRVRGAVFKDDLTLRKVIGVLGVIAGLFCCFSDPQFFQARPLRRT